MTDLITRNIQLVEYKTCEICSFRLMRVEPSIGQTHPFTVEHCPICGMSRNENGFSPGKKLSLQERLAAFEGWLADLGLDRELLEHRYHLHVESFFAN